MITLDIVCMVIVLIIIVVVLVVRAARDNKVGHFKFSISASLLKLCTFGIEVESQRESARVPPGAESSELPPSDGRWS